MTNDTTLGTATMTMTPAGAEKLLRDGKARMLDVRSTGEYGSIHIPGAVNIPLDQIAERSSQIAAVDDPLIIVCRSGARARKAHETLRAHGMKNIHILDGGILAWEAAALPLKRGSAVWDLERQVRFAVGLIVALSVTAGYLLHGAFFAFAGAVGLGLLFAAVTNTCILGMALLRLPYNRSVAACPVDDHVRRLTER